MLDHHRRIGAARHDAAGRDRRRGAGRDSTAGSTPQAMTSALSLSRFGARSLAPAVSAARTAKPSTLERSNGGASTGAITSAASTRESAAARGKVSPPSGERSMQASKRRRASTAEITSRNCSCRAARRTASRIAAPGRDFSLGTYGHGLKDDLRSCCKTFAVGRDDDPAVAARERRQ